MRLIDADELRNEILFDSEYDNDTINYFLNLIDFQPTVDDTVIHLKTNN